MPNAKISELSALVTPAAGDLFAIVDVSDTTDAASGTTKKISFADLSAGGGGLGAVILTGTPTAGQVPTATSGTAAVWDDPAAGGSSADEVFQTEDDGFDTGTLDPKWTQSTIGTLPTVTINPPEARSHYLVKWPGGASGGVNLEQAFSPAGDFSLTIKWKRAWGVSLIDFNVINTGATDGVLLRLDTGIDFTVFDIGGGYTISGSMTGIAFRPAAIYTHIQRVGTAWTALISFDGVSWTSVATLTKTVTISRLQLSISQPGTAKDRVGIDWVRRDWFVW